MRAARKLKSDRKALPLLADRFSTGSTTASENEQLEDVQLEYMQESQPPKAPPRVNSLPRIEVAGDKDSRPFYRGSLAADLQRLQREALDSTESCEPQPRQVLPRKLPSLHVFGAAEEQAELEGILAAALVKVISRHLQIFCLSVLSTFRPPRRYGPPGLHTMGMTTEEVVRRAFLNADVDQSGTLDIQEFGRLLQLLNPSTWSQERLQLFFLRADKDGSGRVDLQETLDWLLYGASRRKKEEVATSRPAALDDAVLEDIAERKRRSSEVLGSAFLIGGCRHKEQNFNRSAAVTNTGLLIFAVLALSLPSILDETHSGAGGVHAEIVANHSVLVAQHQMPKIRSPAWLRGNGSLEAENRPGGDAPLWYSRFIALCMLIMYVLLIFFQLVTHTHLFEGEEEEEEDEPGILGFYGGIFWLAVTTIFIATLSQWIVDTIEGAAASLGMPILFISGILVPIVGNAAEHAAAIVFAYRNKMEIALGSAVGSAVQISVFVIPLCVVIGWMMDKPMTMNFHFFETSTMLLTSISIAIILMDGKANWLKGSMLLLGYMIISAGFWAHADPDQMS